MPEPTPALSIIVVSFNRPAILERCLAALVEQVEALPVEILVVRPVDAEPSLRRPVECVRWISAAESETVPRMRSRGIDASRGTLVALLEDDCLAADGWCRALLRAHQRPCAAVGGPIEPGAYARVLDWGVFFCEYARFMAPFAGEVAVLPGNNIAYKRSALAQLAADVNASHGFYETFANARLRLLGEVVEAVPDMVVHNINSWPRRSVTVVPYHHGRGYAGLRLARTRPAIRWIFAAMALALPAVRVARVIREVVGRRRYRLELARAFPYVVLFSVSWSAGELMGYLFGAGTSLTRWR